jgi:DNA polymerase II small subunit
MSKTKFKSLLKEYFDIYEDSLNYFDTFSEDEMLIFLKKIEIIKSKNINIKYLNKDLIEIIHNIDFNNTEILDKFITINWEDFNNLFNDYIKDKESLRKKRIYKNFIEFIKLELGLIQKDNDKVNEFENKTLTSFDIFENNLPIYKKYNKFDIKADLNMKINRFDIDVLFDYTKEPKKISVSDFVLYFNRRLDYFTNLLKSRVNIDNVVKIGSLRDFYGTNTQISVIGLINEIKTTSKGHYMIELEDKSGKINCFVNKEKKDLVKIIENLSLDEGIAIVGAIGDKIIWVDDIVIPSPPNNMEFKTTAEEEYILFMSDLHFGAGVFVDEAFSKFLDFINGNTNNEKLNYISKKVKYIIVPGDIIEGIGIYPDQGKDARILSSELQYHEAARWLKQIPKDKPIIIIPGNHDTDRLSEPQPKLPYDKAYALYNLPNVIMLSNPSRIRVFNNDSNGGLEIYMYHGGSIFYYADKIKHLRELGGAKVPEKVIEYLLEKRHLAPSHGATLYIPDNEEDPLVIKKMPDFFAVGHTHKLSMSNYKGCTICSCGCWVEMSDYQEKMGMYPDVGKVIVVNTKTRKPSVISFYTEKHNR